MNDDAKEKMAAFQNAQRDWTSKCRICGETVTGTPQQLKEHAIAHQSASKNT